jgi:hypothetical protein
MSRYDVKTYDSKDEEIDFLKLQLRKIVGGFQFLFITLSIGIISQNFLEWAWIDYLIKFCVFSFTAMLIFIKNRIDKKAYKDKRGEK